ncbi:MAG: methylated-DNA--[protein]-cysteine S-methyltransferase [Gemmatimonadetes bacterium]|nr:methylated-DNA--[protein]-cysteine S-methyltransferase [Gemmatimonadota bacterium]
MQEARHRQDWDDPSYAPRDPVTGLREHLESRYGEISWEPAETGRPLQALRRYFDGDVRAIDKLDVDPGGTEFQAEIWRRLRDIPAGATSTYGDLARSAGRPDAARAAGGAVGANPIPIVIPCHRIVGSNRTLTGFGGGLPRKKWLLEHEGALARTLL